jgi:hypothetical protein
MNIGPVEDAPTFNNAFVLTATRDELTAGAREPPGPLISAEVQGILGSRAVEVSTLSNFLEPTVIESTVGAVVSGYIAQAIENEVLPPNPISPPNPITPFGRVERRHSSAGRSRRAIGLAVNVGGEHQRRPFWAASSAYAPSAY